MQQKERNRTLSHTHGLIINPLKQNIVDYDMYKCNSYQPYHSDQCWWQDSFLEKLLATNAQKYIRHIITRDTVEYKYSSSADWKTNVKCKHFQSATGQNWCERFTGKLQIHFLRMLFVFKKNILGDISIMLKRDPRGDWVGPWCF